MLRDDYLHSLWAFENVPLVERLLADKPEALPLQTSYVAGFQYHMGEALWIRLAIGDALQLIRERENRYDRQAVRVDWRGHKLGYVPRAQNHAVAQLLDRGKKINAHRGFEQEQRSMEARALEYLYRGLTMQSKSGDAEPTTADGFNLAADCLFVIAEVTRP